MNSSCLNLVRVSVGKKVGARMKFVWAYNLTFDILLTVTLHGQLLFLLKVFSYEGVISYKCQFLRLPRLHSAGSETKGFLRRPL